MATDYSIPTVDYPITAVTYGAMNDAGAAFAKSLPAYERYRYWHQVTYTLADGRSVNGKVTATTKPKLAEKIADLREAVDAGQYFAYFRGDTYEGIVQKLSLSFR